MTRAIILRGLVQAPHRHVLYTPCCRFLSWILQGPLCAVPCPGRGDILLQRLHIDRLVLLVHEESVALVQCIHVSEQWEEHAFVPRAFHMDHLHIQAVRICQTLNEEGWIQESCSIALGFGQLHVRLNPKVTIGHRCGNLEHGIFGLFGAVLDLY